MTVTLIVRGVPGSASAGIAERLDFLGALLAAVALSGSVFAVTEEPARGWSTLVIGSLAAGFSERSRLLRARREPGRRCSR